MASVTLLFFGLMLSVPAGNSITSLFKLKCEPAVGDVGQTTHISCSMESQNKDINQTIKEVVITRSGEKKPSFTYQPHDNTMTGDPRFKVLSDSSLQLQSTAISDEGFYRYLIRTTRGVARTKFTISVTGYENFPSLGEDDAKYNNPVISSRGSENFPSLREDAGTGTWTGIVMMVIVCVIIIIIIFLIALWLLKMHMRQLRKARSMELPSVNFYNPADADENFAQDKAVNVKAADA